MSLGERQGGGTVTSGRRRICGQDGWYERRINKNFKKEHKIKNNSNDYFFEVVISDCFSATQKDTPFI